MQKEQKFSSVLHPALSWGVNLWGYAGSGFAGLRLGSGTSDVPVVAVTLAVTSLSDLPLQQRWQEGKLP